MPDQPPTPPTTQDFPDHWGFYLLQAINRLNDKIDQKFDSLGTKIEQTRREMDQKLDGLRYWYWGTVVVMIMAIITALIAHL